METRDYTQHSVCYRTVWAPQEGQRSKPTANPRFRIGALLLCSLLGLGWSAGAAAQSAAMTINKSFQGITTDVDGNNLVTVGDTLSYLVQMTNTGTVPLTNVVVSDPRITPNSMTCASVAVGATCDLTGTYVVNSADESVGSVSNTGSATSTEVPGPINSTVTVTVVTRTTQLQVYKYNPSISIDADSNGQITAGDTLSYYTYVYNTGTQPLTNVTITDPTLSPSSNTCPTLNYGGTCALTGTYVVTAADASAGSITNTSHGTSTEIPGPTASNTVTTTVIPTSTSMTLYKYSPSLTTDADSNNQITIGDTITYYLYMTNTGTTPLTNVVMSDPLVSPGTANCGTVNGGGMCYMAVGTYVVTAADGAAGSITNTGTVTATELPSGVSSNTVVTPVITATASLSIYKYSPSLTTDADGNSQITVGDTLTYYVYAQNTGTQQLTNVVVNDPLLTPNTLTCPTLNSGAYCQLVGTYVVTTADETAGSISNTGTATSTEVPGPITSSTVTTPVVTAVTSVSITEYYYSLSNDADANGQITVGDTVTYQAYAQNTGTQNLTNVVVSDPALSPSSNTCPTLSGLQYCYLTGTYVVTAADETAGSITNTASVTSTEIPGPTNSAPVVITVNTRNAAMTVTKTLVGITDDPDANGQVTAGDTLTYKVSMRSTGSLPLTNITVTDPKLNPNTITCPSRTLNQTCDLLGTYLVTAADNTAGSITNTGSATSTEIPGPTSSNTLVTPVGAGGAAMTVTKALSNNADGDGSGSVTQGDVLTFTVTATNTGSVPLTNVVVSDTLITPNSNSCASVAVAGTCTLTGTYTVTAADATTGSISNTGSATSTEVPGPVTGSLTTPVVAGAAPSTMFIISGDAQTLTIGVPSQPLVVELKSNGTPLPGKTITWSTTNGTLGNTSTTTDAAGQTSTTLTITATGPVTVTASFAGVPGISGSSVTFGFNNTIASTPALSSSEVSVAVALDTACADLQTSSTLTPEEQDLLDQCLALQAASSSSPALVAEAVQEMLPDVAETQTQTSQIAVNAQNTNLSGRLVALRNGASGVSFGGLTLTAPGGSIPILGLGAALMEEDAPAKDSSAFSRWGLFVSGNIGRGESDATSVSPRFDFDINGITVGVDYRKSDSLVIGGALGYTSQDTTLAHRQGSVDMNGFSISGYASWYHAASWYLDGSITFEHDNYDHKRRIIYTLPDPGGGFTTVNQVAKASSGSSDFSLASTFGRDFHKNAWQYGVYGKALYSRMNFDGFSETVDASQPGSGLALHVNSRTVTALSSVLGGKLDYTRSTNWGVLMPHLQLEWQHEFKSDPEAFTAFFLSDPTGTPVVVVGDAMDSSYFKFGVGLSIVMTKGRSGFFLYEKTLARDRISQDNLSLGFRIEF